VLLIRQNDHARLSGRLAELWGNPPWRVPQPRERVALGASLHDLAWVAWDEAAMLGDERPAPFYGVPRTVTAPMYVRGIDAVERIDAFAGLLASLHYAGLFSSYWGWEALADIRRMSLEDATAVATLLDHERARQVRLRGELNPDEAELERAYKYLQLWDRISLAVCGQGFGEVWETEYPEIEGLRLQLRLEPPDRCLLKPYPLIVDELEDVVPAQRLGAGSEHGIQVTFARG
jgi:uncharacterized protein DUF3891